jgi:8-oxo-dGTP pyrophosphatase MutT (NUDIX family)
MQRNQATRELDLYVTIFPEEKGALAALALQLETDTEDVFDRKNMRGHLTTSAFVIDVSARKVLLIHHKLYDRWLQPGGHYEGFVALWQSALREVVEETGVQSPSRHAWTMFHGIPFDIDSHAIAPQLKKKEGGHLHHDYVYLVTADSTLPLIPQEEEVFDAKWVTLDHMNALQDARLGRILQKLTQQKIIA